MRVRAAVVKPMRMVVPWCRPNKVIGAKLHITGAVRKGARPSLACGIRIDGRDRGVAFLLRRQQHVGVRVGLVAKIGAGPPGWGHPGGPPDRRGGGWGRTRRSQPFSFRRLESSGEMMRLSSFDPIAALGAARPLVATG